MGFGTDLLQKRNQRLADKGINQQAPGSASTQVKINGPSQAEQIAAGASSSFNSTDKLRLGDKDYRNRLAYEEVKVAQQLLKDAGREGSFTEAIDALNQPGARRGPMMVEALRNDNMIQNILQANDDGVFIRNKKPEGYIGEGMFAQVREIAPGYVAKEQAPIVEWPPLRNEPDGSVSGGYLNDYRDVQDEVWAHNQLKGLGISPTVEAFNIEPSGATEVIFRDLRDNYEGGEGVYSQLNSDVSSGDPTKVKTAKGRAAKHTIQQKQQEAKAALRGVELYDRHEGNIMYHKMMDRPLQIDLGMHGVVSGFDRDNILAGRSVDGMRAAGLTEEADILHGLLTEAVERNDYAAFHDLAQQGVSRLMKLRSPVSLV